MSGSDIFGNLDNFLENYDDDFASTSALSEVENGISSEPNQGCNQEESKPSSTPSIDNIVQNSNVEDDMQRINNLFDSIYKTNNPVVNEFLKSSHATKMKRSIALLNDNYQKKPSRRANDGKFKKKIESLLVKLSHLNVLVSNVLLPVVAPSMPATRRRSRRINGGNDAALDVIVLDPDDDVPTTSSRAATASSNVISVDSDDDEVISLLDDSLPKLHNAADDSFETENYEMRIKVKWGMGVDTFILRKFQKFGDIIARLAAKESADKSCILLNLDDRIVYATDTPDSIGYKPHQFISGRILKDKAPVMAKAPASSGCINTNAITVKVQMEKRKEPLRLEIGKDQTMSVLIIKCAEELNCHPNNIRLYFDGEQVDNNSKPDDLELEGDEMMDIRFVK
ncbi:uncharacterized protein CG4449 [Anopheles nili]|uniref:uncharacterized protein CG4449 n=1 Tax=Anopheles nili TaxID=185578 RepID=UPI00237B15ED|nr:uncharacterized protein CG4449 [Anopheles nili]